MSETIEIKRAKCRHCGKEIARIPYSKGKGWNTLDWAWIWAHVTHKRDEVLAENCVGLTAEPSEGEGA